MSERTRPRAALDLVAEIPRDPGGAGVRERLRDVVERFGLRLLDPDDAPLGSMETTILRLLAAAVDAQPVDPPGRPTERPLLSRRETECLVWTAAGKTTWEIAGILAISQNTVDGYIASATRKLGAVNRTQAVAEALRRGFID